jgi:glycine/D-amino acid oxidase-like deaminating enzyme
MSPRIEPVVTSETLPREADAVVIGAGVIGVSTALFLQERGLKVVIVEKGEVAAEQSSRNWGWCRQMGRDEREVPLVLESLRIWDGMNARVGAETGFRRCGIVYLSDTEADFATSQKWHRDVAAAHKLPTRLVGASNIDSVTPGTTRKWAGALYTEEDGRAEPFVAVPAMARHFMAQGGVIKTGCAARGIEQQAGAVSSVVTEQGVVKTKLVVLAGGYWSSRFLHNMDVRFPQTGVVSSVQRTAAVELGHQRTFSGGAFAARKRLDGGYTVAHNHAALVDIAPEHFEFMRDFFPVLKLDWRGLRFRVGAHLINSLKLKRRWALDQQTPFEQVRVLDPVCVDWLMDEAIGDLRKAFPAFADVKVVERWAGMIDATPDAVPVIDKVAAVPGLHLASGFSGHGFGIGPGAGKLMVEIALGETPCVDPTPFRFSRFGPGFRPQPTTGV